MRTALPSRFPHMIVISACVALCLVPRAFCANLVVNGDFESDTGGFVTWPGYVANGQNPANVPMWTGTGGRGINPITNPAQTRDRAPFRDNGNNTSSVAFLQGAATLEQVVSGFNVGSEYVLSLDFNAQLLRRLPHRRYFAQRCPRR
jgi:hypothetical protein